MDEARVEGFLSLELHSDLDEIKRVGGTSCDHGSDASFHKTFHAHFELDEKVYCFVRIREIGKEGRVDFVREFSGKSLKEKKNNGKYLYIEE